LVYADVAQHHGCALMVMSTHGRSGPGRWRYGSVAEEVLRSAPIRVVVVPPTTQPIWRIEATPIELVTGHVATAIANGAKKVST
jgi:hypothetical protein